MRAMTRNVNEGDVSLRLEAAHLLSQRTDGHKSRLHCETGLTDMWYKTILYTYPVKPQDMNIAFVMTIYVTEWTDVRSFSDDTNTENLNRMHQYPGTINTDRSMLDRVHTTLIEGYIWSLSEVPQIFS